MAIWIYGDLTVDNYEFEHPGDFTKTYQDRMELSEHPYPGLGDRMRNRFVVRKLGGAHLLARNIAIAISLWNMGVRGAKDIDENISNIGLHQLEPWAKYRDKLQKMQHDLESTPTDFEDILNLFYRVSRGSDKAYRMQPEGYEGYTLPMRRLKHQELFRCILGAGNGATAPKPPIDDPITLQDVDERPNLCMFNDGGTRLRQENPGWLTTEPWANETASTWAVVKSHEPYLVSSKKDESQSPFFEGLYRQLPGRVILVMNAEDLRRNGAAISRSLSWEKSVADVVDLMKKCPIGMPRHVVITFDYDAALYLQMSASNEGNIVKKAVLVFSTNCSEGEYQSTFRGSMPGAQSVFVSILGGLVYMHLSTGATDVKKNAGKLFDNNDVLIEKMLTYALIAKQRMLRCGFEPFTNENIFNKTKEPFGNQVILRLTPTLMYHEAIFALPHFRREASGREKKKKHDESPPSALMPSAPKPDGFSYPLGRENEPTEVKQLRKDQAAYGLSGVFLGKDLIERPDLEIFDVFSARLKAGSQPFVDYVRTGKVKCDNAEVPLPIGVIGQIKTISSLEIESLRAIRRLMQSYLSESNVGPTPLGLAVFGQPGSGKSFTVKSVLKTLTGRAKDLIEGSFIECNLSGLSSPEDISHVFQRARDFRLRGKVPVMFFDEFDCNVGDIKFFWLKHFLAPLQDGVFTSGQMTHPIGKSIFVFAGGVTPSFANFATQFLEEEGRGARGRTKGSRSKGDQVELGGTKGRDFLSRLQGDIDVEGIWPIDEKGRRVADPGKKFFGDPAFRKCVMRRAILLREILGQRVAGIFKKVDGTEVANMDEKVIRAFLREGGYRHGIRSIEAIIRMSSVDDGARFTPECLPTREQLRMHVSQDFHDRAFGVEAVE